MSRTQLHARDYERLCRRYLRLADGLLPDRLVGFYVVGSAALGEYTPGRSDVDFVAALDRCLTSAEMRRLRLVHVLAGAASGFNALVGGYSALTGTCNGVFVDTADLAKPVTKIVPVASHTGGQFNVGDGFDVNPVMWKILADCGVRLRGPKPEDLDLKLESAALRSWNLENLETYWRPWANQVLSAPAIGVRLRARWWTAWGVLGAPRLHHTIATGQVLSKESAGEYALKVFNSEWHSIVEEGLAYRKGLPLDRSLGTSKQRLRRTAEFVLAVADSAQRLRD